MLKKGQRVRIFLDETSRKIYNNPLRKYHNKIARVADCKRYRNKATVYAYTLEGVQSAYGIPYEFIEEWLIPYDVEVQG